MVGKLPPIYLLILSILLSVMQIISFNAYQGLLDVDIIQKVHAKKLSRSAPLA